MGVEAKPRGLEPAPPAVEPAPRPEPRDAARDRLRTLWQAERLGAVFEQSRVRRIGRAQDALSLIEEKVYDFLWGPRNLKRDEFRLAHASLQRISEEARINIKTAREMIPRLVEKGFIEIEMNADPRRNTATLYRVWSYSSVLARQRARQRFFVVKTGKGVFYVHPMTAALEEREPVGLELAPTGVRPMGVEPTPGAFQADPAGPTPMAPMGAGRPKPMGPGGALSIGIPKGTSYRHTTPAAYAELIQIVRSSFGAEPDTALLDATLASCVECAVATTGEPPTEEELLYFARSKAKSLARASNVRNHLAVFRRALPECFSGEAFRIFREAARHQREAAAEAVEMPCDEEMDARTALWAKVSERHRKGEAYDMRAIAADAELDSKGRQIAQQMLKTFGPATRRGLVFP